MAESKSTGSTLSLCFEQHVYGMKTVAKAAFVLWLKSDAGSVDRFENNANRLAAGNSSLS
jgi:hypothetical protein